MILGVDGISDFNALHSHKHDYEVQLYAFDILAMGGDDLATGGDDLAMGGGNCQQIDTWPGLEPEGGYDSMAEVTWVDSADVMGLPANALSIEDYVSMGEKHPKMVTYANGQSPIV